MTYQIDGDGEQNRIQIKCVTLGRGQKVKYHEKLIYKVNLNFLYQMFSQIKDIKHIDQNFYSVSWVIFQEWDLGVPGVKN